MLTGNPSSILTLGFGSWGSTGLVLTLGLGSGEAEEPGSPGLEYSAQPNRIHYALGVTSRLHYTTEPNRLHYTAKDEDQ